MSYKIKHICIAGEPNSDAASYLAHLTNNNDNVITIDANGRHISELITNFSVELLSLRAKYQPGHPYALVIKNLNYGQYSTYNLTGLIRGMIRTINTVNHFNDQQPIIGTIYWTGTRMTLIDLLADEMAYQATHSHTDYTQVTIKNLNQLEPNIIKTYNTSQAHPFRLHEIDATIDPE